VSLWGRLESNLREQRSLGRALLVPYLTGGLGADWTLAVEAAAAAGADAVEIGLPFSDPVMDGPVIQEASQRALAGGATPDSILAGVSGLDVACPLATMSYYNTVFRAGHERFAARLAAAGVAAAIVPDLPFVESGAWRSTAAEAGVETILLAAPTTPDRTLAAVCEHSRGFVYAVGVLGVTGNRDELAATATVLAARCKALTDRPVLIGVGVSTPAQAVQACSQADGVVVGTTVVRAMMDGGPAAVGDVVGSFRAALDGATVAS
jgi:tryptophan synthase alpha chain